MTDTYLKNKHIKVLWIGRPADRIFITDETEWRKPQSTTRSTWSNNSHGSNAVQRKPRDSKETSLVTMVTKEFEWDSVAHDEGGSLPGASSLGIWWDWRKTRKRVGWGLKVCFSQAQSLPRRCSSWNPSCSTLSLSAYTPPPLP